MKISDIEGFPSPARVRIALHEKGALDAVDFVPVEVMNGERRISQFKARDPCATLPYAELEYGTCISQCTAIIEYIDGAFEHASLIEETPKQRAVVQMMNLRAEAGLVDAVGAVGSHWVQVVAVEKGRGRWR